MFTPSKNGNEIQVTALATNGKTIILGYSNGTCGEYDIARKCLREHISQLSTSGQTISKFDVQYYETNDKSVKTTILISLINGIVKWWNYDNLSLYTRFNVDITIDFSYYKTKGVPHIALLTKNKYIHVFQLDEFWTFSKIAKIKLK
jgi:hypothetical protein